MKCGCVVGGASCLKEGQRVGREQRTYPTKPNGRRFVIYAFSIYVFLSRQWEFPLYNFLFGHARTIISLQAHTFPCMDVPMTISFKTSVTFLALLNHRVALRCNFSIVNPFPMTSPFTNFLNLNY